MSYIAEYLMGAIDEEEYRFYADRENCEERERERVREWHYEPEEEEEDDEG